MKTRLRLHMLAQPDDATCGPTCLHAVYDYYGDRVPLQMLIRETETLESGGTLAVMLGRHALRRGYRAIIYTYNLHMWDPTWFRNGIDLAEKLRLQAEEKTDRKLRRATRAYLDFLARGGVIRHAELNPALLRHFLKRNTPILTGLSATYLYSAVREYGADSVDDDIRGEPAGHFVVLCGYDMENRTVAIADPYEDNPLHSTTHYEVGIDRVIGAILLGIVTYDANLLIIEPTRTPSSHNHA
jgi:hypothetical protein